MIVAAVLLFVAVRGVHWSDVVSSVRAARFRFLVAAFATGTLAYALRAWRWRMVLSAARVIDFATVFWASSAGYLGNSFLPGRAGELVRSAMVSATSDLSRTYVLTTALVERAVDMVVLLVTSAVIVLCYGRAPSGLFPAATAMLAIALGVIFLLIVVPRTEHFWKLRIQDVSIPERWRAALVRALEQIALGVRALHNRARLLRFVILALAIWSLDASGAVLVGRSLGLNITFEAAFVLLAALAVASTIPSTPGYVGIFQFVTVTVVCAYGADRSAGLTYSLVLHAATYAIVTFWGLIGLWKFRTEFATRYAASLQKHPRDEADEGQISRVE